jgi:hypothetical protein
VELPPDWHVALMAFPHRILAIPSIFFIKDVKGDVETVHRTAEPAPLRVRSVREAAGIDNACRHYE